MYKFPTTCKVQLYETGEKLSPLSVADNPFPYHSTGFANREKQTHSREWTFAIQQLHLRH